MTTAAFILPIREATASGDATDGVDRGTRLRNAPSRAIVKGPVPQSAILEEPIGAERMAKPSDSETVPTTSDEATFEDVVGRFYESLYRFAFKNNRGG